MTLGSIFARKLDKLSVTYSYAGLYEEVPIRIHEYLTVNSLGFNVRLFGDSEFAGLEWEKQEISSHITPTPACTGVFQALLGVEESAAIGLSFLQSKRIVEENPFGHKVFVLDTNDIVMSMEFALLKLSELRSEILFIRGGKQAEEKGELEIKDQKWFEKIHVVLVGG